MPAIRPRVRLRASRKGRSVFAGSSATLDRLSDLVWRGENPGNLHARCYVPDRIRVGAPLVVVLHGCTQDAAVYDHGSGWSTLADRHGFALLFPEQKRANNPMLCFNWFSGSDTQRGMGEAASIRSMVEAMKSAHGIDPERIFVTGLSAGGAMASAMLATYPETFAAGAIIAGVAYGCAADVAEAFDCMGGRARSGPAELGDRVRRASPHKGPWPRVQVWQGSADRTVVASNADAIVRQWADLHGLGREPDRSDRDEGYPRRTWLGAGGEPLVEQYVITGMAHGIPLDGGGEDPLGEAGAHMLDVGLSSTARIAAFFAIAPAEEGARPRGDGANPPREEARPRGERAHPARSGAAAGRRTPPQSAGGVQQVIEDALRKAGLMR
ncbi:MAG TPA: PHB depolymerase family esterase [Allosphingosinicella sp.]|jgi:poly(hydroxyalkanoate) depolymerase family esterase|nr:PHB depolymerase family esterase [Allosphingosinicella sp.]